MCKEEKLYKVCICCKEHKHNIEFCKRVHNCHLRFKDDEIFIECDHCWSDRLEALFDSSWGEE